MIGKTLGHYEITTQLGKGGMGEVWKARDTKLGREVAVKTLPEEFARDEERLARFEREAKLLASLNHPNIAAIYGLEESGTSRFLVLELVEGDTTPGEKPMPFLMTQFQEHGAAFSPDGHWLAYASDESGRFEVYVTSFPGPGGRITISTGGGGSPLWSGDGRELFYRNGNQMMAVSVRTSPTFSAGTPQLLFEGDFVPGDSHYDVSADGQRFLIMRSVASATTTEAPRLRINIVLNWFEELKARVPVR